MEKRRVRQTVIFQYDRVFNLGENPIYTADHSFLTAEVRLREVLDHLTRPVDPGHDVSYLAAGFDLSFLARPGTVGYDQQLRRPSAGNGVEHAARRPGSFEYEKSYGRLQSIRLHEF